MGKNKQKHEPGKWALAWREAEAYGCIMPEDVPDCPKCKTDKNVGCETRPGTCIFVCRACKGNIVVVDFLGDYMPLFIEDLEKELGGYDAGGERTVGLGVYSPMDLVEELPSRRGA